MGVCTYWMELCGVFLRKIPKYCIKAMRRVYLLEIEIKLIKLVNNSPHFLCTYRLFPGWMGGDCLCTNQINIIQGLAGVVGIVLVQNIQNRIQSPLIG